MVVEEYGDVKPGIYDLQVTGGDGYVSIKNEKQYYFYSSFGMSAPGTVIEFSNISKVKFNAVAKEVTPFNELGIGNFVVGRDIKPGTYKLSSNVSFDGEYSAKWDIRITNLDTKRSKDQTFDKENSDVAVKLEEGELVTVGLFNTHDSATTSD